MKRIIVSRTDSIGDVVLTLPILGWLKSSFPSSDILFLGKSYTKPVVHLSENVTEFIDWDKIRKLPPKEQVSAFRKLNADLIIHVFPVSEIAMLAKKAGIPERLGTTNRLYHWTTCNRLVSLSRKNSSLHEAQLNLKLIKKLCQKREIPSLEAIPDLYGLKKPEPPQKKLAAMVDSERLNVIIHPKSKGSAREWGTDNFRALINSLEEEKFNVFITGTESEGEILEKEGFFAFNRQVYNLLGKLSLEDLISFISTSDALVAGSTGPLHIAAAYGIQAIGLYPPIKPMHPGRWAPVGKNALFLVKEKKCTDCRNTNICECLRSIPPEQVRLKLEQANE